MTVKINTKALGLGKDTMNVKGTIAMQSTLDHKLIAALDAAQAMVKATDMEGFDGTRQVLEAEPKTVDACLDFIRAAFKLTEKDVDKIKDNCTMQAVDLLNYCTNLLSEVKGTADADSKQALEAEKQKNASPKHG